MNSLLKISSKHKINGTTHDYEFVLPKSIDALQGQYIIPFVSIPLSFYNIREKDNNELPVRILGVDYLVVLEEKNYSGSTLMEVLKQKLDTATTLNWTITSDEAKGKFTFAVDAPFTFQFGTKKGFTMFKELGFNEVDITSQNNTLTSPNFINLQSVDSINVLITGSESTCISSSENPVSFFCPINKLAGNLQTWEFLHPPTLHFPNPTRQIRVSLSTDGGKKLNLNGIDWFFHLRRVKV